MFARQVVRERLRFQDQARRLDTSETEPPDEFLLGLNDGERMELLQLLEQPLTGTTGVRRKATTARRFVESYRTKSACSVLDLNPRATQATGVGTKEKGGTRRDVIGKGDRLNGHPSSEGK